MKSTLRVGATILMFVVTVRAQGSGWLIQSSPSLQNLYGVAFSDRNTWIAVGAAGTIIRTSDGGQGWKSVASPTGDALRGVSFRGSIGVAVGIAGRILRSTDAGSSWVQGPRPTTKALYAVSLEDSLAVITGEEGTILVSTDAGTTWALRTAGTASILFGVSLKGGVAVGVGGQGAIVMSGGLVSGWASTSLGQLLFFYGISMANPSTGWAVGASVATGSIVIKTTLSGITWTPQTAPTTNTLTGVSFAGLDTGTAVGFNGTIIRTTNGGTEWVSQQSNTNQSLNAVSFVDSRSGVAVGDSGTILRTTDGGLTDVSARGPSVSPSSIVLFQNYPNPFNPTTTIGYSLPDRSEVKLTVFNALGQQIALLLDGEMEAGNHTVRFDGTGLSSGVYFYRLSVRPTLEGQAGDPSTGSGSRAESREFIQTRELLLLK
jgi:photosystem II stability/assembly factor-like uncharacterized protein